MDPGVLETDGNALQRPLLASRVQRDSHGGSGTEGHEEIVVGGGSGVRPTCLDRLVGGQSMRPYDDLLCEARCSTADDDRAHTEILFLSAKGLARCVVHRSEPNILGPRGSTAERRHGGAHPLNDEVR